ncbi:hypothetical protein FACS1894139_07350 [Planctomycetales bacterium]|jgi:hypothetical protein|nr:hypothetical protein [Planctomycetota bacterium]GHS93442.1 hypothetical protein FACS1894107_11640 [Planctomycetales bacterium]GHT04724.1 hypothetical protein FACS1894139_07350 [Planctomycetales bacterium]GHV23714.1 hypothetical protein AGMMS49959_17670 [Planctomycetales bacterium]
MREIKNGWADTFWDGAAYDQFIASRPQDLNHRERPAEQNLFAWLAADADALKKGADGETMDETLRTLLS